MSVDAEELKQLDEFFTKLAWEDSVRYGPIGCIGKAGERGCMLLRIVRGLQNELELLRRGTEVGKKVSKPYGVFRGERRAVVHLAETMEAAEKWVIEVGRPRGMEDLSIGLMFQEGDSQQANSEDVRAE